MPELPEVAGLVRFLGEQATGKTIDRVDLATFAALKTFDPPLAALHGRTLRGTDRRGKFLLFDADGLWLVVHLARGGWIRWKDQLPPQRPKPGRGPLALRVRFTDGSAMDITEMGTEKRLAAYVVGAPDEVEGVARLGPDALAVTAEDLARMLAGQTGQLKKVLSDQSVIAGIGNAYSDEILHAARLSPFKVAGKLTADEVARVHAAMVELLTDAAERARELAGSDLKAEKKSSMRVHGRTGQPCPVCGDTVREVAFANRSLQYCATCQTGGKPLADRRLSRLLK